MGKSVSGEKDFFSDIDNYSTIKKKSPLPVDSGDGTTPISPSSSKSGSQKPKPSSGGFFDDIDTYSQPVTQDGPAKVDADTPQPVILNWRAKAEKNPLDPFGNALTPKPAVNISGRKVELDILPINSPAAPQDATIKTKELQERIDSGTYTSNDVEAISQSWKKSPQSVNAYLKGKPGTGDLIHLNDIKNTRKEELKAIVNKANQELGRNDDFDQIFSDVKLAGDYAQKIQTLYDEKANREDIAAAAKAAERQSTSGYAGFGAVPISYDLTERDNTLNAAQQLKKIVQLDISEKVLKDKSLTYDQKVKQLHQLSDKRNYTNVNAAIADRAINSANPYNAAADIVSDFFGKGVKSDTELLNANKAGLEVLLNNSIKEEVAYNTALINKTKEDYQQRIAQGNISEDEKKAFDKTITEATLDNQRLIKEHIPDKKLFEKYPVLFKRNVASLINDYNARKSGNVEGVDSENYQYTTVEEMLRNNGVDPSDQRVKDVIRGDAKLKDYSFFGDPVRSALNVFTNTGKGIMDLTGLRDKADVLAEKTQDELFSTQIVETDELQLTTAAKTAQNIGNTTGQVIGQGLLQAATGGLGRMAGLSKVAAANAGFWTSGTIGSYDSHYKETFDLPIESEAGRIAYAGVNAIFEGATEKIFPEAKLFQIPGFKDAVAQIGSKLSRNELTEQLAEELLTKAKNEVVDYAVKYGDNILKETAEESLTSAFNSATKLIAGDPNMNWAKAIEDVKNTAIQTAVGTSFIAGFGAHKDVQAERNVAAKNVIYNAGLYHDEAVDAINKGFEQNFYDADEKNAKIKTVNTAQAAIKATAATENITGKTLERPSKELYVANLTAEALLTEKLKDTKDPLAQGILKEKISNLQNQRKQILAGEVAIDEYGNISTPQKIENEKTNSTGAETKVTGTETAEVGQTNEAEVLANDMAGLSHADWFLKNKGKFTEEEFNAINANLTSTNADEKATAIDQIIAKKSEVKENIVKPKPSRNATQNSAQGQQQTGSEQSSQPEHTSTDGGQQEQATAGEKEQGTDNSNQPVTSEEKPGEEKNIVEKVKSINPKLAVNPTATEEENLQFFQEQALSAPNSFKNQLNGDEETATDLIALNSRKDIENAIKYQTDRLADAVTDDDFTEIDNHVQLLEKGLAKKPAEKPKVRVKVGTPSTESVSEEIKVKAVKNADGTITVQSGTGFIKARDEAHAESIAKKLNGKLEFVDSLDAPTQKEIVKTEGQQSEKSLTSILGQFDNDENYTAEDLVNDAEALAESIGNKKISDAVEEYRAAQEEDRKLSGRGDMDSATEKFEKIIREENKDGGTTSQVNEPIPSEARPAQESVSEKPVPENVTPTDSPAAEATPAIPPKPTRGRTEVVDNSKPIGAKAPVTKQSENESEKVQGANTSTAAGGENIDKAQEKAKRAKRRGTRKANRTIRHPEQLKALTHEVTDPFDMVLQYFIGGGKVNSSAIEKVFGNKGRKSVNEEVKRHVNIINKEASTITEVAHSIWSDVKDERLTDQQFVDAIEQVITQFTSQTEMARDLNNRMGETETVDEQGKAYINWLENAYDTAGSEELANEAIAEMEEMSQEEMEELVRLDAQGQTEHFDRIIAEHEAQVKIVQQQQAAKDKLGGEVEEIRGFIKTLEQQYSEAKAKLETNGQQDQLDIFGNKKSDELLFKNDLSEQREIVDRTKALLDKARETYKEAKAIYDNFAVGSMPMFSLKNYAAAAATALVLISTPVNIANSTKAATEQTVVADNPKDAATKTQIAKLLKDYYGENDEQVPDGVIDRATHLWEAFGKPEILPDSTKNDDRAFADNGVIGNITGFDDFVAELAHSAQFVSQAKLDDRSYRTQAERDSLEYDRKGSVEYDAHTLIEPMIAIHIISGKTGDALLNSAVKSDQFNEALSVASKYNLNQQLFPKSREISDFETPDKTKVTVEALQKKYPDAVVVATQDELPDHITEAAGENDVEGVLDNGNIYLVAEHIDTMGRAEGVYRHEKIGHKGVIAELKGRLDGFVTDLVNNATGTQRTSLDKLSQRLYKKNADQLTDAQKNILGQEYIAVAAEKPESYPTTWQKITAFVRNVLRDLGINLSVSDNDIKVLLDRAAKQKTSSSTGTNFSIVGEKANLSQQVRDNLGIARQMEEAGKSSEEIYLATGWERGSDEKFRYDLPDITLASNEWQNKGEITLQDMIKPDSELVKAYPELNNAIIEFVPNMDAAGSYSFRQDVLNEKTGKLENQHVIQLNTNLLGQLPTLKSVLIHEIQHGVQQIEGFAKGGNVAKFEDVNTKTKLISKIKEVASSIFDQLPDELKAAARKVNNLTDEDGSALAKIQAHKEGKIVWADYINAQRQIAEIYNASEKEYPIETAYDQYTKLAGEVEARNAEKRLNLTDTQRKEIPISYTEDVARKDQIKYFGNDKQNSTPLFSTKADDDFSRNLQDLLRQAREAAQKAPEPEVKLKSATDYADEIIDWVKGQNPNATSADVIKELEPANDAERAVMEAYVREQFGEAPPDATSEKITDADKVIINDILSKRIDSREYPTMFDMNERLQQEASKTQGEGQADRFVDGNYVQAHLADMKSISLANARILKDSLGTKWKEKLVQYFEQNPNSGNVAQVAGLWNVLSTEVFNAIGKSKYGPTITRLRGLQQRIDALAMDNARDASLALNQRRLYREFAQGKPINDILADVILTPEQQATKADVEAALKQKFTDDQLNTPKVKAPKAAKTTTPKTPQPKAAPKVKDDSVKKDLISKGKAAGNGTTLQDKINQANDALKGFKC